MDTKVCFLFGHSTAPYGVITSIEAAAERHYHEFGIRSFYVGNRGNFDKYAATAIRRLKGRYDDISLTLLPCLPSRRTACRADRVVRQLLLSTLGERAQAVRYREGEQVYGRHGRFRHLLCQTFWQYAKFISVRPTAAKKGGVSY